MPLPFPPLASGLTCEVLGEDQGDQQDGDEHGADGDHAVKRQLQLELQQQRGQRAPPCRPARRAGSAPRSFSPTSSAVAMSVDGSGGWCMGGAEDGARGPRRGRGAAHAAPRAGGRAARAGAGCRRRRGRRPRLGCSPTARPSGGGGSAPPPAAGGGTTVPPRGGGCLPAATRGVAPPPTPPPHADAAPAMTWQKCSWK